MAPFTEVAATQRAAWFTDGPYPVGAGHGHTRQPPHRRALPETPVRLPAREPGRGRARDLAGGGTRRRRRRGRPCSAGREPTPPTSGSRRRGPTSVRRRVCAPPAAAAMAAADVGGRRHRRLRLLLVLPVCGRNGRRGARDRTRRRPGADHHRWPPLFRGTREQLLPPRRGHHGRAPCARGGGTGLVSAMGWYATKHAVGVYGATPPTPRLAPG